MGSTGTKLSIPEGSTQQLALLEDSLRGLYGVLSESPTELRKAVVKGLRRLTTGFNAHLGVLDNKGRFSFVILMQTENSGIPAEPSTLTQQELRLLLWGIDASEDSLLKHAVDRKKPLLCKLQPGPVMGEGCVVYTYEVQEVEGARLHSPCIRKLRLPPEFKMTPTKFMEELLVVPATRPAVGRLPEVTTLLTLDVARTDLLPDDATVHASYVRLYSWICSYLAFTYQVYVLSQATAEQPARLSYQLMHDGWVEVLRHFAGLGTGADKQFRETLEAVMGLEHEFPKRQIVRDIARVVSACFPDAWQAMREEFLQHLGSSSERLRSAGLRHVQTIYEHLAGDQRDQFLRAVLSKVEPLLLEPTDSETYPEATSAAQAMLLVARDDLAGAVCDSLVKTASRAVAGRRAGWLELQSLLLSIVRCRMESRVEGFITTLSDLLTLAEGGRLGGFLCLIADVLPLLSASSRDRIACRLATHELRFLMDQEGRGRGNDQERPLQRAKAFLDGADKQATEVRHSRAVSAVARRPMPIAFVSQKGGTGKSLLALALGSLLSEARKTCLVELDFFGPTLYRVVGSWKGVSQDKIYLNEYVRAVGYGAGIGRRGDQLIERAQWPVQGTNLTIVPCNPQRHAQELMWDWVEREKRLHSIRNALNQLVVYLARRGYDYVLLDCPAELKELADMATSVTQVYEGLNVFVATLFEPSLLPLLELLPREGYRATNYLLVNKVRTLDRQFVASPLTLVDYITLAHDSTDDPESESLSETMLGLLLHIDQCWPVAWCESAERCLSVGTALAGETEMTWTVPKAIRDDLQPLFGIITGSSRQE